MFKKQQVCGLWQSDITAEMVAGSIVRYADVRLDGEDLYWLEGRPREQGRNVIVCSRGGQLYDLLPAPYNARSRVHEYGGGAYAVHAGHVWFVNDEDQQVYHLLDGHVSRLTDMAGCRFADLLYDPHRACLYAVRENHGEPGRVEPVNELVCIKAGVVRVIAGEHDFFASPALSPDGRYLAWLSWDHPNMPWDTTTLWLARIYDDGGIGTSCAVLDEPGQAVFQPMWCMDGRLYFVNDPEGWWQLYRLNDCGDIKSIEQICHFKAEMGLPLWQFGMRTYAFQNKDYVVASLCEQGLWRLVKICVNTGEVAPVASPYNSFVSLAADENRVVVIAAGHRCGNEVASIDLCRGQLDECLVGHDLPVDDAWISVAETVTFPVGYGESSHGFYYPPANPHVTGIDNDLPPLLVMTHGGPTGATTASFNFKIQFWTSRGFAVLDVNYRGSTGYGRAYRDRLRGQWGVYDVEDVAAGADYLVKQGKADPERLMICGSSAGGYTVLAALAFTDTFRAGASYYGIGDLVSLIKSTHKFEARYLDGLVGEYPQEHDVYIDRSPLHHVEKLSCPVIFMQGEEDRVVPPPQAEKMADALRAKGLEVELLMFAGEQHGFRRAETIVQTLESELAFYTRVFHFV